jgi:serine O-acetyltransferase
MEKLLMLLKADLERQLFFEGRTDIVVSTRQILTKTFSPRFMPVVIYRLSHHFHLGAPIISKAFSLMNFLIFGLEISPRCPIGPGLFFPHTIGTVIGAESIGARATIYHGVTLGATVVDIDYSQNKRPIIEDDVVIGAGAKVLGGILVGQGARIGANALVISNVPANSKVFSPLPKIVLEDEYESKG